MLQLSPSYQNQHSKILPCLIIIFLYNFFITDIYLRTEKIIYLDQKISNNYDDRFIWSKYFVHSPQDIYDTYSSHWVKNA